MLVAAFALMASAQALPPINPCPDNATTADAITCLVSANAQADLALAKKTADVAAILRKLPAGDSDAVVAAFGRAEARWRDYVKQTCDGVIDPFWPGGTVRLPAVLGCEARLKNERTWDLDALFYVPLHD